MSGLKNCNSCGRLFAGEGNVCRRCQKSEDDEYGIVRKYVRDYPGASIFEVAEATGVEEKKVLQFLRDGRLQSKGLTTILECERCGTVIPEGKYCNSCLGDLRQQFGQVLPKGTQESSTGKEPSSAKDRMYTKGDRKR